VQREHLRLAVGEPELVRLLGDGCGVRADAVVERAVGEAKRRGGDVVWAV
jgi:hypothetical protein